MQTKSTKRTSMDNNCMEIKNMRNNPATLVFSLILISLFFASSIASTSKYNDHSEDDHDHRVGKHFVLVHGACLGAWSWYKLVPPLKAYGHNVTAIDLAASGTNLSPVNGLRTLSDYAKPLLNFMESVGPTERIILVGHSLGGASVSLAMELFPKKVSVAIFVTAVMPGPSLPLSAILQKTISEVGTALDNKLSFDNGPNNPPTNFIFGPTYTSQVVYQFSPPQDAALANLLIRTLRLTSVEGVVFTKEKYGSVNRVFILVEKDRVVPKQDQVWMIEKTPPNRVVTISDSDHMVMASRPEELLVRLLAIARDFS